MQLHSWAVGGSAGEAVPCFSLQHIDSVGTLGIGAQTRLRVAQRPHCFYFYPSPSFPPSLYIFLPQLNKDLGKFLGKLWRGRAQFNCSERFTCINTCLKWEDESQMRVFFILPRYKSPAHQYSVVRCTSDMNNVRDERLWTCPDWHPTSRLFLPLLAAYWFNRKCLNEMMLSHFLSCVMVSQIPAGVWPHWCANIFQHLLESPTRRLEIEPLMQGLMPNWNMC